MFVYQGQPKIVRSILKTFLEKRVESNKTQFFIPCKGKTIERFIK